MTDAPTLSHPMHLTPSSSNVLGLEYHEPDKALTVHFRNGGVYRHLGVTILDYTQLLSAESVGKHYSAHIRGKYESTKIESAAKPDDALSVLRPAEYSYTCGSIGPDALVALSGSEAAKIEAILIAARCVQDADGKHIFHVMPPALALAIIQILAADDPLDAVHRICTLGKP